MNKWNAVAERLPDPIYGEKGKPPTDSEDVLVLFPGGDSLYEIASYQHDLQRWILPNKSLKEADAEPTHWMPIPEAPK